MYVSEFHVVTESSSNITLSGVVHTANKGATQCVKLSLRSGMENYKTVRWWFTRGSSEYRALTGKIVVLNTEVPLYVVLSEFFVFGTLVVKLKQVKVLVLP